MGEYGGEFRTGLKACPTVEKRDMLKCAYELGCLLVTLTLNEVKVKGRQTPS